jgi:hypothetical protein
MKILNKNKQTTPCHRDFQCYKSDFTKLCNMVLIGDGDLIECLDRARQSCLSSLPFDSSFFCLCPLRAYIAREFNV